MARIVMGCAEGVSQSIDSRSSSIVIGSPLDVGRPVHRINEGFRGKTVADINKAAVTAYIKTRGKAAAARRELEDLRAAINHAHEAGFLMKECSASSLPRAFSPPVGK